MTMNTSPLQFPTGNNGNQRDTEKPIEYLNIYFPMKKADGTVTRTKLGNGVRLFASRAIDQRLCDLRAKAEASGNVEGYYKWLFENLIIEQNPADAASTAELAGTEPDFL